MNPDEGPHGVWKDRSTQEAYEDLKGAFVTSIQQLRARVDLTSAEKDARLQGITLTAEHAFSRYGGVPALVAGVLADDHFACYSQLPATDGSNANG